MRQIIFIIYRVILSLRYRVKIVNKSLIKNKKPKLLLPNHQAHADHQLLMSIMVPRMRIAPLVAGRFFKSGLLRFFLKLANAIPVSDLQGGEKDTEVMKSLDTQVREAMLRGNNILLYPSGQLTGQGLERIFNKQGAYMFAKLLCEAAQIVAVRVSGLWGSRSSRAWNGDIPKIVPLFLRGSVLVILNLIFFMPRRRVTFEFIDITEETRKFAPKGKTEFNTFLESVYNEKGEEQVSYIKYHFLAPKLKRQLPERITGSEKELQSTSTFNEKDFAEDIVLAVKETIKNNLPELDHEITVDSHLNFDLHVDSLAMVIILEELEKKFPDMPQTDIRNIKKVGDLCALASGKYSIPEELKESKLHQHIGKIENIYVNPDKDIVYNFLHTFTRDKNQNFAWDKILGNSDRKTFFLKASVVSLIIKNEVKSKYVGVMLPALQSTTLLLASCYLAGKIPVMFNWTTGPAVMVHCLNQVKPDKILTAGSFYSKIEEVLPDEIKEKCIFFEQKVRAAKLGTKLKGLFLSKFPKSAFKQFNPDETAVVLFTSGSESKPKGVPLTHRNLIADLHGVIDNLLQLKNDNILLSFLPPFHSFGFTVLSILPLVSGIKVAYTPNPLDRFEIQRVLKHTKSTILIAAPTFLKMLLTLLKPEDLESVRIAISGSEALHASILESYKTIAPKDSYVLEGYGITECSPILSLNPRSMQKLNSVGVVIEGVDCVIADIETNEVLKDGTGMIMVSGPTIFNGYLDKNIDDPFVEIEGKKYYRTGDLGYIDKDGYLFITGRLKRFIKIGAEMVSLPAIESALIEKYGNPEEVVLAVEGTDKGGDTKIVVFSIVDLKIDELNKYLIEKGFSSLSRISELKRLEEIPLLGTGKTDYKELKKLVDNA